MKLLENKNMSLVLKSILVVSILVFIVNYYFKNNKIREDFFTSEIITWKPDTQRNFNLLKQIIPLTNWYGKKKCAKKAADAQSSQTMMQGVQMMKQGMGY